MKFQSITHSSRSASLLCRGYQRRNESDVTHVTNSNYAHAPSHAIVSPHLSTLHVVLLPTSSCAPGQSDIGRTFRGFLISSLQQWLWHPSFGTRQSWKVTFLWIMTFKAMVNWSFFFLDHLTFTSFLSASFLFHKSVWFFVSQFVLFRLTTWQKSSYWNQVTERWDITLTISFPPFSIHYIERALPRWQLPSITNRHSSATHPWPPIPRNGAESNLAFIRGPPTDC